MEGFSGQMFNLWFPSSTWGNSKSMGVPHWWMVFVRENPSKIWMILSDVHWNYNSWDLTIQAHGFKKWSPKTRPRKPTNMVRVVEWTKKGRLMSNWNQCLTIWRDKSDAPVCIRCINLVSSWGTSVSRVTNVEKGAYWSCLTKFLRRDLMESRNDSAQHWIYEWQLHFMFERYVYVYTYVYI